MTAALTIGADGTVRIEIVLRLDIVLKTEGAHVLETPQQAGGVVGDPAVGDTVATSPVRTNADATEGRDAGDLAGSIVPDADRERPAVEADLVPPLPPADPEPQPAAEAGGQPAIAASEGAAAPPERIKRPARKSQADMPGKLSRREIAIAAYERGATFFEAGREAGVSRASVGNWVREAGIPVRLGAWKLPPQYPRTAIPKPAAQAAPKMAAAPEPARPVTPSPRRTAPRPLTGDEAAIAEAIATGRVTRVPDASAFAKLPAIVGINHARSVLESGGATVRRAGSGWDVDGRKVSNQGLIQAAQATQRQALLDRSVPA
jgi:hypothetical protein